MQSTPNPTQFQQSFPRPQALKANTDPTNSAGWYLGSGASHHVTSNSLNIHQHSPFEGPAQTDIGNGQGLSIQSIGTSSFKSPYNSKFEFILKKPLHVYNQKLTKCQSICSDNSVFFEFHPNFNLVKSQANNEVDRNKVR